MQWTRLAETTEIQTGSAVVIDNNQNSVSSSYFAMTRSDANRRTSMYLTKQCMVAGPLFCIGISIISPLTVAGDPSSEPRGT